MWGAQARAAEYTAAKNASQRQANREAEEQNLPPKQAPVSLSVFTKNAKVSRNKGNKSWHPLVLDDGGEDDFTETSDPEGNTSTPTKSRPDSGPGPSELTDPADRPKVRVNIPQNAVPVAPRSMLRPNPTAAHHNQTPPQLRYPGVMGAGRLMMPTAVCGGMTDVQAAGVFPYPELVWMPGLQVLDVTGYPVENTPEGMRRYGGMLVPTEITPTKQEQKLSMMSHAYPNPLYNFEPQVSVFDLSTALNAARLQDPYNNMSESALRTQGWDDHQQQPPRTTTNVLRLPSAQQAPSDDTPNATHSPAVRIIPKVLARSMSEAAAAADTPSRPEFEPVINSEPKAKESEEPYDRALKMQKFVAAQQALAKTGKTVLRNPDLHKVLGGSEGKQNDGLGGKIKNTNGKETSFSESLLASSRMTPAAPPGLEKPAKPFQPDLEPVMLSPSQVDIELRQKFGVGTSDWFELKPVTRQERKEMLHATKEIACRDANLEARPLGWRTDQTERALEWLNTDPRRFQAARENVKEIAQAYCTKVCGAAEGGDGNKENIDIHGGLVRGAGNVLANLTEYLLDYQSQSVEATPDYFNRTKPAPEFAVERGGLGANICNISLFEDDKSVFFKPPSRIARDPRFRPASRESIKSKSEDDWVYRYNTPAYGTFRKFS